MHIRCPHCHNPIEIVDDAALKVGVCSSCGSSFSLAGNDHTIVGLDQFEATQSFAPDAPDPLPHAEHSAADVVSVPPPQRIGRYRVERLLGIGGFGLVYLAHDEQLQRLVAIKVPHARLVAQKADADAYLSEARMVANLDHPNIVPVHDVGHVLPVAERRTSKPGCPRSRRRPAL